MHYIFANMCCGIGWYSWFGNLIFGRKSNWRHVREESHKKISFLTPTASHFGCIQFTKDFSESLKGFYSGANSVVLSWIFCLLFLSFNIHMDEISVADHHKQLFKEKIAIMSVGSGMLRTWHFKEYKEMTQHARNKLRIQSWHNLNYTNNWTMGRLRKERSQKRTRYAGFRKPADSQVGRLSSKICTQRDSGGVGVKLGKSCKWAWEPV